MQTLEGGKASCVVANLERKVVSDLTWGLKNKRHVIVMDTFSTSVELFWDLESQGIYATGTMQSNYIGLHPSIKNMKAFT